MAFTCVVFVFALPCEIYAVWQHTHTKNTLTAALLFIISNTLHLISSVSGCDCGYGCSPIPAGMPHAITETTGKLFKNLWTLIHRTMRTGPSPSTRWDLWLAIEALSGD